MACDLRLPGPFQLLAPGGADEAKWLACWTTAFPLRDEAEMDHWVDGLRKAGLPMRATRPGWR